MSNKRLTPEEILKPWIFDTVFESERVKARSAIKAMKEYAAQEVADKSALLKEAIGIIKRLKAICSANYNPIHEEIEAFVKKSTGREAV